MTYKHVYFIGIGGIGMSAIARFCAFKGYSVSGYDRTPSPLTAELEKEGISVHYEDDCSYIPKSVEDTLVVYTPAIPADMGELCYVREQGYKVVKRSQMLGELTRGEKCYAVAGTHGKTTTSTMIAHILTDSGKGCSAFLGGISKNYGTNMLVHEGKNVVVEADEFDRSFHQLHPTIAAITSIEPDHLDIYGDFEHVQEAFNIFASQVKETIILKYGFHLDRTKLEAKVFTYHLENKMADFRADNLRLDEQGYYHYDLVYPGGVLNDIRVGALGWINVENSIAAAAVCLCSGLDAQKVRVAIGTFEGAKRRLDCQVNRPGLVYIDDYAHHPSELTSAISSIKQVFEGKKITGIFQPHLFTRTRDFAEEFAQALSLLDKLILLDIYPAREEPIEGISSEIILKDVTCPEKVLINKSELMDYLAEEDIEVLVTLGAGDIDRFVEPIKIMLESR